MDRWDSIPTQLGPYLVHFARYMDFPNLPSASNFRHYPYTVPFYTPLQILCGTRRNRDSASLMSLYTAFGRAVMDCDISPASRKWYKVVLGIVSHTASGLYCLTSE